MQVALSVFYLVFILGLPALARWGCSRSKALDFLGPVVLCYAGGILLALAALPGLKTIAQPVSEAMIPLAIPLLLMGRNLWVEIRQTGKGLQSFALACLSVCIVAFTMGWLFKDTVPESWKLAGMLTGVYTGSTPNLISVGKSLAVESNSFLLVQASDVITGGVFLLFLLSLMKPLASKFLKPFEGETESAEEVTLHHTFHWKDVVLGTLAAAVVAAISIGASLLFTGSMSIPLIMCLLTFGGLLCSATPLNKLQGTDTAGEYLIQVFCTAVGCQVLVGQLISQTGPILIFTTCIMLCSISLHLLLAKILGHDVDTTLMTSTATIYGPPFIAPFAESIKNRALIGPGLTLAVLGYAVGTWLGLGVAYALKFVLGISG